MSFWFPGFLNFYSLVFLAGLALWVWMLYDCAMHESSDGNDKIAWLLVIIFVPFIGALIYFIARRPERIRTVGR
jgi:hypothetical protein